MIEHTRQIPLGPKDFDCPLWKKPMVQVCHKCPLWTCLAFNDPRTNEAVDRWDCAYAWGPILQLDMIRRQDRTTASIDKVATEVHKTKQSDNVLYIGENVDHTQQIKVIGE